jgi:hypothetical protein
MAVSLSKSKVRSTNDTERTPLVRDSQNTYTGNISDGGTSTDWDTASRSVLLVEDTGIPGENH